MFLASESTGKISLRDFQKLILLIKLNEPLK